MYNALSAEEAFNILEKVRPDLILLDVVMPVMDGYEMIKILKKSSQFKSIPVIFLTAETKAESEVEGFNCGIADYITKPFSLAVLRARVNTQLRKTHNPTKQTAIRINGYCFDFEKMEFSYGGNLIELSEDRAETVILFNRK